MPRQIYFAYRMVRASCQAFPTSLTFAGIQTDKRGTGMFPIKKEWCHIVIVFAKLHQPTPLKR
jgi:hypothetical protein